MIEYISLIAGIETKGRILASMRHLKDRKEGEKTLNIEVQKLEPQKRKRKEKKKHKIQLMKLKGNRSKIQGRNHQV
jgi:hypothetical protein